MASSSSNITHFVAVDEQGREYNCLISENAAVCQALLNKAASYPPEKKYNAKAYQNAAETVAQLRYSLCDAAACTTGSGWVLCFTPAPLKFIREFFKNGGKLQCAHPDNQPIYGAILEKAAAYPPEKKYQIAACMRGAMALSSFTVSLKEAPAEVYSLALGDSLSRFIADTIDRVYPLTKCPENLALYRRISWSHPNAAKAIAAHPEKLRVDSNGLLTSYLANVTLAERGFIEGLLGHGYF
jgi:hypothetical protein